MKDDETMKDQTKHSKDVFVREMMNDVCALIVIALVIFVAIWVV